MKNKTERGVVWIVLDNIRSAYNVGAMFRTADGAGVTKILLVGTTPQPIDRFGREVKEIAKTSLGATKSISWEYYTTITEAMDECKKTEMEIVSVEQTLNSKQYTEYRPAKKVVYVLGNEIDGVSQECLNVSDVCVELPMLGMKESLNVATACGIVLYQHRAIE